MPMAQTPDWALEISDMVSIEDRLRWCNELIPELTNVMDTAPETAADWVARHTTRDARALLKPGIEALARTNRAVGTTLLPYFS